MRLHGKPYVLLPPSLPRRGRPRFLQFRLPRPTRLPLALEVTLAISIKLLLLAWIWQAFFSAPQTKKMRMPTAQVEQHLLSAAPLKSTPPPVSPSQEVMHDSH